MVIFRHKVKELIEFVQDDEKLREERKKAKKNKDKFIGLSNEGISGSRNFGRYKSFIFLYYTFKNIICKCVILLIIYFQLIR